MNEKENIGLITVITPTYNKFDTLKNTIDSVLMQDYRDIEYIITDDGSAGFPQKEIDDYISKRKNNIKRYKIIHHKDNVGTVKNLNNAISNANGKIIMFLSSDDVFYSDDVITKVCEEFDKRKCDLLVASRYCVDKNGQFEYYLPHISDRKAIEKWDKEEQRRRLARSTYRNMASGSIMYVRKSVFENMGGFDEKYVLWEDGPFLFNFTQYTKIECAYDLIAIKYRVDGISSGKNPILVNDGIYFDLNIVPNVLSNDGFLSKEFMTYKRKKNEKGRNYLFFRFPHIYCIYFYEYIRDLFLKKCHK